MSTIIKNLNHDELLHLLGEYSNFMKLRDDEKHAQWEIAQVAKAMKELV